jgi:ankyrin repeat protein
MRITHILSIFLIGLLFVSAWMIAATETRVADAAMKNDQETVRSLIKQAVDVNGAQGDGMTALHWAALNGNVEIAQMLLYAGANVKATTRIGSYTPLFMAAKTGNSKVVDALLTAGANANEKGTTGMNALMMAATSGDAECVRLLLEHGAYPNAKETERGQTALGYAASFNRPAAIQILLKHGADVNLGSTIIKPTAAIPKLFDIQNAQAAASAAGSNGTANAQRGQRGGGGQGQPYDAQAAAVANGADGVAKGGGNPKGGLTPLMYAARQGNMEAAQTLLDGGANLNARNGDDSTALLLATINAHFDLAKFLVERGADVNIVSMDGATALYGVVNTQWARKSFQPQPLPKYEKTTYLDLMTALLDRGANPDVRLTKELWFSEYNRTLESASAVGTTAFWKCAEVGDVEGMRLLISRGANPHVASEDGVTPLLMAAGAGVHGNDDVSAPSGRLAAIQYLVEELHADVNAADGRPAKPGEAAPAERVPALGGKTGGGYTALHNAAARGDNQMILYLVSKGAKADAVSKNGTTVVDMANGPRQRIQPYPETVALLEMLGAKNSHKCVSC